MQSHHRHHRRRGRGTGEQGRGRLCVSKDSKRNITKKVPLDWLLQREEEALLLFTVFLEEVGLIGSFLLSPFRIATAWTLCVAWGLWRVTKQDNSGPFSSRSLPSFFHLFTPLRFSL